MRVLHVPYSYPPDVPGGTETYVQRLVTELRALDIDSVVAAPADSETTYDHAGIRVHRFAVSPVGDLGELYSMRDDRALCGFRKILKKESPDVVHMHALTRGASPLLGQEAKRRGITLVFSYHTPAITCQRGTLFRWGQKPCDGVMRGRTCAACTLDSQGSPRPVAHLLALLTPSMSRVLGKRLPTGRLATAIRMRELTETKHQSTKGAFADADHIIAMAPWVKDVLISNEIDARRITVIRHGVEVRSGEALQPKESGGPIRVGWLGRATPTKGLHILIQAIDVEQGPDMQLEVFPLVQSPQDKTYLEGLVTEAKNKRVSIVFNKPSANPADAFSSLDLVAVTSQTFETGPLVVLEAFAVGIPVLGADVPGIRDLIRHGENGLLIERDNPIRWRQAFEVLAGDKNLLARLRSQVRRPPSMDESARRTKAVYEAAISASTDKTANLK